MLPRGDGDGSAQHATAFGGDGHDDAEAASSDIRAVPPWLISGSGTPTTGSKPETMPMFTTI